MTAKKKDSILITAAIILVFLILLLSSYLWLSPQFEIKNGMVEIPDYLTDTTPNTSTEKTDTEQLTFKSTFKWEEKDGARPEDNSICYLWIYTTQEGTMAKFSYGDYLIDGWPVFLVSPPGRSYVFESSENSFVERVRISVDVTDTGMTGTVTNITPEISNFVSGTFTGEAISFEQYTAEVIDL